MKRMQDFPINRRSFVAGGAAFAVAAPALIGRASAQAPAVVRAGIFTGVGLPGLFAAMQHGYFKAENVTPELQFFGGGPAMISALLGGSLDVTHADTLSWATAVLAGREIMLVTPASLAPTPDGDPSSTWRIAALPASGLTKPEQLVGKKLGVGSSQLSMVTVKAWLVKHGVDPNAVKFEIVGQPSAMPNLLSSGAVDAAMLGDPIISQLVKQLGLTIIGWPYEIVPAQATFSGLFGTTAYCKANHDVLLRFVRAYRKGSAHFNKSAPADRAALMKLANIDIEALDQKTPGLMQSYRYNRAGDLPVNVEETQRWVDIGVQYGGVPKAVDIRPFVNDTAKET